MSITDQQNSDSLKPSKFFCFGLLM